jgi:hypothetical protein
MEDNIKDIIIGQMTPSQLERAIRNLDDIQGDYDTSNMVADRVQIIKAMVALDEELVANSGYSCLNVAYRKSSKD